MAPHVVLARQEVSTMSKKSLYFVYDGPALASHEMDVRSLAPALLALSDIFEEANAILNGDRARVSVNVKGSFKTGCFGFDLSVSQSVMQSLLNLASSQSVQSAADIASILGFCGGSGMGLLRVIKWIRGRKIEKIELKGSIAVIHIGDVFLEVEEKVLRLLKNERIRRALEEAIKKPLETEGIESFGVAEEQDAADMELITKSEASYYASPKPEPEDLGSTEYETTLQIIGVTFQEKNKWRFSDGLSSSFYADMLDTDFLARIDNHAILFGKGDIIRARIREVKILDTSGTMRAERAIVQVFEHRNASVQLKLTD